MYTQTIEAVRRQLANQIPPTLEQTAQLLTRIEALEHIVFSAQHEVAQRQDVEAALRASDQHFRAAFEQAAVGMAEVGLDGRWLRVNHRLCAITGYTEAELLARTFQDITYPDDLPRDATIIQRLLSNERELDTLEKRYIRNDGRIIWIHLTVSLVRSETGAPAYFISVIEDVTARRQAENALRRSETQLSGIIDSAMDAIITIDQDQRILRFNAAAESMLGCSAAEAIDQPILHFIPERYHSAHAQHIRRYAQTGVTRRSMHLTHPLYARRTDGSEFPIEATISQVEIAGEQLFTVILRDVTARQQAEAEREGLLNELATERALLETVLYQLPVGVIIAEAPSGKLLLGNAQLEHIWQQSFSGEENFLHTASAYPGFHTDGRPYAPEERPLRRAITSGEVVIAEEMVIHRADGERATLLINAAPIHDHTGRIIAGVATYFDISERKRSREGLHLLADASAVLATSLEATPILERLARLVVPQFADSCAIDLVDDVGTLTRAVDVYADPVSQSLFGERVYHSARSPINLALVTDQAVIYATESVEDPGQEPIVIQESDAGSLIVAPLLARGRTLGVLSLARINSGQRYRDDDRVRVEELAGRVALALDNARLYQELEQALRARDAFLVVAGHELRTPLAPLLGMIDLLSGWARTQPTIDAQAGRWIGVLGESATRLRRLVESLIELAQVQAGRTILTRQPVDVNALVRRLVTELRITPKHLVHVVGLDQPLLVDGDAARLELVFTNLLHNAIKYSPNGGRISVQLSQRQSTAWITVRDSGIGMSESAQQHLFERFYRADNAMRLNIEGLGIGLYLVQDIVKRHAGTISVFSSEGQGSTFTVCLPCAIDAAAPEPSPIAKDEIASGVVH